MKSKKALRIIIIMLLLGSNIGCDQISKNIVRVKLNYHDKIEVIDNHLILTKIENTGAFLSMGENLSEPLKLALLTVLPVIILLFALFYLVRSTHISKATTYGLAFIIGGGIGNIYDRIVYGSVTDFLHIDFIVFQTGIFNMADVSIMTGFFMILFDSFLNKSVVKRKSPL